MTDIISDLRARIATLEKEPCECVDCPLCHGTGNLVFFMGRYAPDCCDDLRDLEPCDQCRGGIDQQCDRCAEIASLYSEIEEEEDRRLER